MLDPEEDSYEVTERFNIHLKELTTSKESISKVTKYALDNMQFANELFHTIIRRMKKSSVRKRIALWYLLDSICQNAKQKGWSEFIVMTTRNLLPIVNIMLLPNPEGKDKNTEETLDPADKEQISNSMKKVLSVWESRNTLSIGKEPLMLDIIKEAYEELDNPSASSDKNRKHKLSLGDEDDTVEEKLRLIEEDRRESKRKRWDKRLRPVHDTEFGEMEELWVQVDLEKVKNSIPNFVWKTRSFGMDSALQVPLEDDPSLKTIVPSPFSPASSLSSPSPSPTTPYSPSNTSKNTPAKKQPIAIKIPVPPQQQQQQQHQQQQNQNASPPRSPQPPPPTSPKAAAPTPSKEQQQQSAAALATSGGITIKINIPGSLPHLGVVEPPPPPPPPEEKPPAPVEPIPPPAEYEPSAELIVPANEAPMPPPIEDNSTMSQTTDYAYSYNMEDPNAAYYYQDYSHTGAEQRTEGENNGETYAIIWDLDDTLIPNTLIKDQDWKSAYPESQIVPSKVKSKLDKLLQRFINDNMFGQQIEQIDDVRKYMQHDDYRDLNDYDFFGEGITKKDNPRMVDPVKIAYRFRILKEMYEGYRDLRYLPVWEEIEKTVPELEEITANWVATCRAILQMVSQNPMVTQVLVSSSSPVVTIAKLIAFRLTDNIPFYNILCSRAVGKRSSFKTVMQEFPYSKFLVIGDGKEEEQPSKQENLPFYKVTSLSDLNQLYEKINSDFASLFAPPTAN